MMVLEIEHQHAESTQFLVQIQTPESMQRFQDQLYIIRPVLQVHITRYLDNSGSEIQIPSTTMKDRKSWG